MSPVIVLAGTGLLVIAAAGILLTLIIGIRRGDRGRLTVSPRSQSDALARRLLVGVRYPAPNDEEAGQ